jgi:hypothetical protein
MHGHSLLALPVGDSAATDLIRSQPLVRYNDQERRLSAHVEHEIDCLILGRRDSLVLLKLYPRPTDDDVAALVPTGIGQDGVRAEIATRIASEALNFFGPLHGGIVVQEVHDDVILQGRRYTSAYPHITLERYDAYDAATSDPLVSEWRARRIQNLRRETRTNRMIDVTLLVLEIGKSVFPMLVG